MRIEKVYSFTAKETETGVDKNLMNEKIQNKNHLIKEMVLLCRIRDVVEHVVRERRVRLERI